MSEETIVKRVFGPIAGVPNPISDWNETNERSTKFIKNKPDLNALTIYNNSDPLINDIGGIKASEHTNGFNNVQIADLLTELLYPYTVPIINSVTLSPGAGVKKKGVGITLTSVSTKITKKSKTISKVDLYKGSTLLASKSKDTDGINITSAGTTITFSDLNDVLTGNSNTTYTIKISEENGTADVVTKSATYTFVNPYYFGIVSKTDEINADLIKGLTEVIESKGSKSRTYTTTSDQCAVIAYPSSYGNLKSIVDANNFTQTWDKYTITIDGVEYYVYVSGAAQATDFKYTFSY